MVAIHEAVINSRGFDHYTGEPWLGRLSALMTIPNRMKDRGRTKKSFWNLPTVDHFGEDLKANAFRICSWRTNDCKNDLSHEELVEFCRIVLAYERKEPSKRRKKQN
jgi:hypothetical protein